MARNNCRSFLRLSIMSDFKLIRCRTNGSCPTCKELLQYPYFEVFIYTVACI